MPTPPAYCYWIRNDLRLHDNRTWEALCAHRAAHAPDAPVFAVLSGPSGWDEASPWGWPRFSEARKNFWKSSAAGFARAWNNAQLGELLECWGKAPYEWADLPDLPQGSYLFASRGHGFDESAAEAQTEQWAQQNGLEVHWVENHDVWDPSVWNFRLKDLPPTFTGFRKKLEKGTPLVLPAFAQPLAYAEAPALLPEHHPHTSFPFAGDEASALAHVRRFIWETDGLARYKETRNGLLGVPYSGKISPWLATGALSVRWVWSEVLRFESERGRTDGSEWFLLELLWRSYFLWAARADGPQLFGPQPAHFQPEKSSAFLKWSRGETPDSFVNAGMHELVATGYLSNRLRQNVASFFIHNLGLPWAVGASFMEHHLLDYETASNWGNWAYIAGVGRNPGNRQPFNTVRQADFYDPDGTYRRTWN
jgi:deoxyribodipyrimidine photo-lyase